MGVARKDYEEGVYYFGCLSLNMVVFF